MAPKQRQVRMEQRGALEAIQALEQRSDEELENETKYKSAALAILGARASERFDADEARSYFQRAIAAARPQERMQLRRMADASLALAERRAGDLKDAVERLGQTPPTGRQMFALRAMGLLTPPGSAGVLARVRGILLIVVLIVVLLALGLGVVELISLPFGGIGVAPGVLLGFFLVAAILAVIAAIGRHRRDRAQAGARGCPRSQPGSHAPPAAVRYNSPMAQRSAPSAGLTVAVTGPTGEIGQAVGAALERSREVGRVLGMARRPFDPAQRGWKKVSYRRGDVLDRGAVAGLVKDADVVVHLAFMIMGGPRETSAVNLDGSRNVFQAAVSAGARRLVYTSSVAAYGFHGDNPQPLTEDVPARGSAGHYYSAQKAQVEALLSETLDAGSTRAYAC